MVTAHDDTDVLTSKPPVRPVEGAQNGECTLVQRECSGPLRGPT
jgi:hypothetical protein